MEINEWYFILKKGQRWKWCKVMFTSRKMCPTANVKSDRSMFCYTTTVQLAMECLTFLETRWRAKLVNFLINFAVICYESYRKKFGWFYKKIFKNFPLWKNSQCFWTVDFTKDCAGSNFYGSVFTYTVPKIDGTFLLFKLVQFLTDENVMYLKLNVTPFAVEFS